MKTRLSYLLPAGTLALLVGIAMASVSVDYDHSANFTRYHTYSWLGIRAGDSLWEKRIKEAVDRQLVFRGWNQVPAGGDAGVSAFGQVTERDTIVTYYDGFPGWGWGGWGGPAWATTQVIPQEIGTLTVDVFDGHTKQLIWRGVASKSVSKKPEKNEKKLAKVIDEMFERFPAVSRT
jgi:hypothetical protein